MKLLKKYRFRLLAAAGVCLFLAGIATVWLKYPYFYITFNPSLDFYEKQNRYPRVDTARRENETELRRLLKKNGFTYPPDRLLLRVFKNERELAVWAQENEGRFKHVRTYPFTGFSGGLGPKRKDGDRQIPEGFYHVNRFNPKSNFYLSLGLNYPNRSDRVRGHPKRPGGNIFIHGERVTVGCIPIGTPNIKELYVLALDTRRHGSKTIPVHIYPARLNQANVEKLKRTYGDQPDLLRFWNTLQKAYLYFENHRRLPNINITDGGTYRIKK